MPPTSPPALNFSQHQGFCNGSALHIGWPKYIFSITWYGSCRLPPYNLHSQYHAYNAENSEVRLCAKSLQRCLTLCNPMDCSPPDPSAHGILQVRILQWVAMPSSRGSSEPGDLTHISYVSCIGWRVFSGGFLTSSTTWEEVDSAS